MTRIVDVSVDYLDSIPVRVSNCWNANIAHDEYRCDIYRHPRQRLVDVASVASLPVTEEG